MLLPHPRVGFRSKSGQLRRIGTPAGLLGPARDRLHHSGISSRTHLKAAARQLYAQPARLFVIGFACARPRVAEYRDDGAGGSHAGNYFTGRLLSVLGSRARRLLIAGRAARVSRCGPSSSTMATQIESIGLVASGPLVPILLPKIEKSRWAPRRVVAYPDNEFTCSTRPVFA